MSIREILLDLEAGRFANNVEAALEFLTRDYKGVDYIEELEGEIEMLRSELALAASECTRCEKLEGDLDDADNQIAPLEEEVERLEKELTAK